MLFCHSEILDAAGICFGKYIPRTGRCKKKIREDGGRVLEMDFNQCCRKKNAKAWQLRVGGIKQCFKCPNIGMLFNQVRAAY